MDVKQRILAAATRRFADYGYAKTTMAEIAADAGMSVGNLYRHFENKEALAIACMRRQLESKLRSGLDAADQAKSANEAFEAFLLARLRAGHAQFANTRHLYDMVRLVNERYRDLLLDFESKVIRALVDILRQGIREGAFDVDDPDRTAYDIHQALMRYNHPVSLRYNELPVLEADLERLIDLLRKGLAPRNTKEE